jgi:tRNA pseudouridine38/39 synthase
LGQRYNGLEFHTKNKTPFPTVEEKLWQALNKAKLVFPKPNPLLEPGQPNWEGCEYSKCGRTDKGVSAFGQVVGIRVRSNRPLSRTLTPASADGAASDGDEGKLLQGGDAEMAAPPLDSEDLLAENEESTLTPSRSSLSEKPESFHHINDEIPYCQILNRLLPPDIRMLAWCPAPPPDFSARFACKERRYKYFFTQPAFTPTIGNPGLRENLEGPNLRAGCRREGYLDIEAMREAAHKFIGLHDFRNFCKLDSSKQIDNFVRRIFHADIEELDPRHNPVGYVGKPGFQQYEDPDEAPGSHLDDCIKAQPSTPIIYSFTLHGSAFLWHQVRHMVSILFLIGQRLEQPSLIDDLLNVRKYPCKPEYEMADDAPLVLWDCIFPRDNGDNREDTMGWVYVGDYTGEEGGMLKAGFRKGSGRYGVGGVVNSMWQVWRKRKMDEVLAGTLLDVVVGQGRSNFLDDGDGASKYSKSQEVFQGGDAPRPVGKYIPILERPRMESVEAINLKYAKRKGFEQSEEMRAQGFRRLVPDPKDNGNE